MKKYKREEFTKKYEENMPMYRAWGKFVCERIIKELNWDNNIYQRIIKMPVEPRVKTVESIVSKAFFRKEKNYTDPYDEITDKVGIRFVVMLEEQIEYIKHAIEQIPEWDFSLDKDYEELKKESPEYFVYQSVHYIVRNKKEFEYNSILIEKGAPCEIQIRTLEQHAYAEMSHDYVYKAKNEINSDVKRYLARSMALNETADELFGRVYKIMNEEESQYNEFTKHFYDFGIFNNYSEKLNKAIYDNISNLVKKYNISLDDTKDIEKDFIIQNIKARKEEILFRQPIIMLIYLLAKNHGNELKEVWDDTDIILESIYSDLGISFDCN